MDQQNRNQSDLWQQKEIHGSICGYPLQKMTSCGDTTVPTGQRLVFPYAVALKGNARSRYENGDNEESVGGRYIGAKLASCLWIFSKAVENNWYEERRRRPIQDMNRICNRVEEKHVSISEFHLAVQEHRHWTSYSTTWKYPAFGNGASFGSRHRQN